MEDNISSNNKNNNNNEQQRAQTDGPGPTGNLCAENGKWVQESWEHPGAAWRAKSAGSVLPLARRIRIRIHTRIRLRMRLSVFLTPPPSPAVSVSLFLPTACDTFAFKC